MRGIVAWPDGGELADAANQQARAREQQHGEGDFGDHQRAAETAAVATIDGVAGGLFEGLVEIRVAHLQRPARAPSAMPEPPAIRVQKSATRRSTPGWM